MNAKLKASLKSFGKFLIWTIVAAIIQYISTNYVGWNLPEWLMILIAATLKASATWVKTHEPVEGE